MNKNIIILLLLIIILIYLSIKKEKFSDIVDDLVISEDKFSKVEKLPKTINNELLKNKYYIYSSLSTTDNIYPLLMWYGSLYIENFNKNNYEDYTFTITKNLIDDFFTLQVGNYKIEDMEIIQFYEGKENEIIKYLLKRKNEFIYMQENERIGYLTMDEICKYENRPNTDDEFVHLTQDNHYESTDFPQNPNKNYVSSIPENNMCPKNYPYSCNDGTYFRNNCVYKLNNNLIESNGYCNSNNSYVFTNKDNKPLRNFSCKGFKCYNRNIKRLNYLDDNKDRYNNHCITPKKYIKKYSDGFTINNLPIANFLFRIQPIGTVPGKNMQEEIQVAISNMEPFSGQINATEPVYCSNAEIFEHRGDIPSNTNSDVGTGIYYINLENSLNQSQESSDLKHYLKVQCRKMTDGQNLSGINRLEILKDNNNCDGNIITTPSSKYECLVSNDPNNGEVDDNYKTFEDCKNNADNYFSFVDDKCIYFNETKKSSMSSQSNIDTPCTQSYNGSLASGQQNVFKVYSSKVLDQDENYVYSNLNYKIKHKIKNKNETLYYDIINKEGEDILIGKDFFDMKAKFIRVNETPDNKLNPLRKNEEVKIRFIKNNKNYGIKLNKISTRDRIGFGVKSDKYYNLGIKERPPPEAFTSLSGNPDSYFLGLYYRTNKSKAGTGIIRSLQLANKIIDDKDVKDDIKKDCSFLVFKTIVDIKGKGKGSSTACKGYEGADYTDDIIRYFEPIKIVDAEYCEFGSSGKKNNGYLEERKDKKHSIQITGNRQHPSENEKRITNNNLVFEQKDIVYGDRIGHLRIVKDNKSFKSYSLFPQEILDDDYNFNEDLSIINSFTFDNGYFKSANSSERYYYMTFRGFIPYNLEAGEALIHDRGHHSDRRRFFVNHQYVWFFENLLKDNRYNDQEAGFLAPSRINRVLLSSRTKTRFFDKQKTKAYMYPYAFDHPYNYYKDEYYTYFGSINVVYIDNLEKGKVNCAFKVFDTQEDNVDEELSFYIVPYNNNINKSDVIDNVKNNITYSEYLNINDYDSFLLYNKKYDFFLSLNDEDEYKNSFMQNSYITDDGEYIEVNNNYYYDVPKDDYHSYYEATNEKPYRIYTIPTKQYGKLDANKADDPTSRKVVQDEFKNIKDEILDKCTMQIEAVKNVMYNSNYNNICATETQNNPPFIGNATLKDSCDNNVEEDIMIYNDIHLCVSKNNIANNIDIDTTNSVLKN